MMPIPITPLTIPAQTSAFNRYPKLCKSKAKMPPFYWLEEKHRLLTDMQHTPLFNHVSRLGKSGVFRCFCYRKDGVAQEMAERIAALDSKKTTPFVNKLF